MKLKEIIARVKKTDEFMEDVDVYSFAEAAFGISEFGYTEQDRLVGYYFHDWYCTDTRVGYKIYFFDDEPVAGSSQVGRKCSENFEWISKDAYNKVKDYIKSFIEEPEVEIVIMDQDEEFDEFCKIEYYSQLYKHHKDNAYYKGEKVSIVDFKGRYNDKEWHPETVRIKGSVSKLDMWIEPKELDFKYNID